MKRGKKSWVERGKSLLILVLTVSALVLLSMTPLVQDSGVLELIFPDTKAENGSSQVTLSAAARPSRMAVNTAQGRYGLQYDQEAVDELFSRLGPLLGEGLTSCSRPQAISEQLWQTYLGRQGIYFDFSGRIPLSALGAWLSREGSCPLEASARRILLAEDGELVLLCYQDEDRGLFFSCTTTLSAQLHLGPALADLQGNDARFAFEDGKLSQLLQPYTLITEQSSGDIYQASNPLADGKVLSQVVEALEFSNPNHAAVVGGEAYLDGESNRLEVTDRGTLIYRFTQTGKYPVARVGEQTTVAEAIEAARNLAEATIGSHCGQAQLYLISAQPGEAGFVIRFGYRLNGSSVWLDQDGWAGEFVIQDGWVTQFTLHMRCYTDTGADRPLLTADRAAVMLPGLTDQRRELMLRYQDLGVGELIPMWMAE